MSDLWLILVLLGVGIVATVLIYNWWQERKYRQALEQHFETSREDVLTAPASPARRSPRLNEETEGWMSEPRVRGATTTGVTNPEIQRIEPSFVSTPVADITDTPETVPPLSAPSNRSNTDSQNAERHSFAASTDEVAEVAISQALFDLEIEPVATTQTTLNPAQMHDTTDVPFEINLDTQTKDTVTLNTDHPTVTNKSVTPHALTPAQPTDLPSFLHLAMDWVGTIALSQPAALVQIADLQTQLSQFTQFTSCWIQCDGQTGWQNLLSLKSQANHDVVRIACAIQLADRGGPVDAPTIERFRQMLLALSLQLGGECHWCNDAPLKQAHAIDAFSIEVDKAVEFHVVATQGMFHATKLRGLAEANGLQLSELGRFERVNAEGLVEFSIRNLEGKPFSADMLKSAVMTGMTFQLDIPTTPNNVDVFEQMVQLARQFANSLHAELLDVNRKPIAEPQLAKIRQQLTTISATMQAQGIFPGGQHARRLFS